MAIEDFFAEGDDQPTPTDGGDAGQAEHGQTPTGDTSTDDVDVDTSATPGAEGKDERMVPLPALRDERRKRQQLAEQLVKMERQLAYMQGQQEARGGQAEPQQDEWDDDSISADLTGSFKKMEQRVEERVRDLKYRMSYAQARAMYPDFEKVLAELEDTAKEIPQLGNAIATSDAPAITAYLAVKEHLARKEAPKNEAERIEAEVKKRLEAELAKLGKAATPTPLSSVRGTGAATAQAADWSGPTPLKDLFGGR